MEEQPTAANMRQCFICMEEAPMDETEERDWVSPCRCSGTIRWVHQRCIRRWVLTQEKNVYAVPACAQCLTPYRLHPPKGWPVAALQIWYKFYPFLRFWAGGVVVNVFVEASCTLIGTVAVAQVYGIDETMRMIDGVSAFEAVSNLYLVGASLVVYGLIPFSNLLLDALRVASRLPVLGRVLPSAVPQPRNLYEPRRRPSVVRSLTAALLLPTCSRLVGQAFFGDVDSLGRRVLFGGAVFLAVKGSLAMYLRQKLMVRRCRLVVHDYEQSNV